MHRKKSEENRDVNPGVKPEPESIYISPRELVKRWQCARSSVDRIARRAGLTRVCFGEGINGMIRYLRHEVEAFEQSRQVKGFI